MVHPLSALRSVLVLAVSAAALSCASGGPAPAAPSDDSARGAAPAVARSIDENRRSADEALPRHYTPVGPLPAAAPVSTFGPDGERIDPVASLQALLDAGEVTFTHDPVTGWLPSVLAALDIPISSQVLVFSRTSLQTEYIAPWVPRAIYFNDDVYVGHVGDDVQPIEQRIVEVAAMDPDDGGAFYFLSQNPEKEPRFVREGQTCLMCHTSDITEGVPGVMVRSVLTGRMGRPITPVQDAPTTDRTPMARRYAGWYVTGTGAGVHGGNVWAPEESHEIDVARRSEYVASFDFSEGADVTDLTRRFDTSIFLSEHSDLVALLVLTHQTRIHNLITVAHQETKRALREQDAARVTRGLEIPEGELLPTTEVAIDHAVDRLVREMLFVGAEPLDGPIRGTSGFAEEFEARGPFDAGGRTLRAFDLQDRLFRYPLSYLIYARDFDALPELTKVRVYRAIDRVLRGEDRSGDYDHLDAATRAAIREILLETKPDFAAVAEAPGS
jgi:hypothetical protein